MRTIKKHVAKLSATTSANTVTSDNTGMKQLDKQLNEIADHEVKKFDQELRLIKTLHGMGELVPYKLLSVGNPTLSIDTAIIEWLTKNAVGSYAKALADSKKELPTNANDAALTRHALDKQSAMKRMGAIKRMFREGVQVVWMLHHMKAEQVKIEGTGTRKTLTYNAMTVNSDWIVDTKVKRTLQGPFTLSALHNNASSFIAKMLGSSNVVTKSQQRAETTAKKKAAQEKKRVEEEAKKRDTKEGHSIVSTLETSAKTLRNMTAKEHDHVVKSDAFESELATLITVKFVPVKPTLAGKRNALLISDVVAWIKSQANTLFKDVDLIDVPTLIKANPEKKDEVASTVVAPDTAKTGNGNGKKAATK